LFLLNTASRSQKNITDNCPDFGLYNIVFSCIVEVFIIKLIPV